MIQSDIFKNYIPVFTAFLGAFLAYIFNNRKYKFESFRKEATESLTDFYSPIFHEMRNIKNNLSEDNKYELLSRFIKKYTSINTNIFKSYNENLVNLFYKLDDEINMFEIKQDSETLDKLIILERSINIFDIIYAKVEKEYINIQKSLYSQNPWYMKLHNMNPIFRFIMDLSSLCYSIMQFLLVCWGFVFYLRIVNRITGQIELPSFIITNFKVITFIILLFFIFAFITRLPYILTIMDYRKENKSLKMINKIISIKIGDSYKKIKSVFVNKQ